jgi:hypothetical protein
MDQIDQKKRKLREEYDQYDITSTGTLSLTKKSSIHRKQM